PRGVRVFAAGDRVDGAGRPGARVVGRLAADAVGDEPVAVLGPLGPGGEVGDHLVGPLAVEAGAAVVDGENAGHEVAPLAWKAGPRVEGRSRRWCGAGSARGSPAPLPLRYHGGATRPWTARGVSPPVRRGP